MAAKFFFFFPNLRSPLRVKGLDVPKDSRTLMKTPRSVNVIMEGNDSYHYIGIGEAVKKMGLPSIDSIKLMVNIDGLPLF